MRKNVVIDKNISKKTKETENKNKGIGVINNETFSMVNKDFATVGIRTRKLHYSSGSV